MAARKPKFNNRPKSGEQQIDSGGGVYPPGFGLSGSFKKAVNQKSSNIGSGIGDAYFDYKVAGVKTPSGKSKVVNTRGDVYTPGGVYKGKNVFIQKPALTDRQIQGVVQGQITKIEKQASVISSAGRVGAKIGIGVGGSAGLVAGYGGREIVKGVTNVVNQIRKSDKSPKSKIPKKK